MEVHAKLILTLCLLAGFGLAHPLPIQSGKRAAKESGMQQQSNNLWTALVTSDLPDEEEIQVCHASPDCLPRIVEFWRNAGDEAKVTFLGRVKEIGAQWQPGHGEVPGRFGPFLVQEELVSLSVEALQDQNPEVRDAACRILAKEVPDTLVRNHAAEIVKSLRKYPESDGGALLSGKLGSKQALDFLAGSKELLAGLKGDVQAAFGKFGDSTKENELIAAYQNESDPRKKNRFAWYLAYMGKPKSLGVLSQDIRTPFTYAWNQKALRSFRIHVISALAVAYPFEPLLWKPVFRPSEDSYYAEIEAWAERVLGTTWRNPRPPFLYEEQVPSPRPGGPH